LPGGKKKRKEKKKRGNRVGYYRFVAFLAVRTLPVNSPIHIRYWI
jgi:hypothetical protein